MLGTHSLILVGFAYDSAPAAELPCVRFDQKLPSYVESLVDSRLPASQAATLGIFAGELIRTVLIQNVSQVIVFFGERYAATNFFVLNQLRKALPDLTVIAAGTELSLPQASRKLSQGLFDLVVHSNSSPEILAAAQAFKERPASHLPHDLPKTLWRNDRDQLIQWSKSESPGKRGTVLLVMMPAWNSDFPPYGLAYLSATLKAAGYGVRVLDLNLLFWKGEEKDGGDPRLQQNVILWSLEERFREQVRPRMTAALERLKSAVLEQEFVAVGFSLFQTNLLASQEAIATLRSVSPDRRIVCGGPSCTESWAKVMFDAGQIDAAVFGEGDRAIIDVLQAWETNGPPVPGAWLVDAAGSLRKGGIREPVDIESLPIPDFSEFPVFDYRKSVLPVHFSRGCVGRCAFCFETFYWRKYRSHSPERCVALMRDMKDNYGITRFMVADSLMNGDHARLERLADILIEQDLRVTFEGYCRADGRLSSSLLRKLKKAGCVNIFYGIESGSQKVLGLMRKGTRVTDMERVLRDTHAAGIPVCVSIMVGFPGETWIDFGRTFFFLLRNRKYFSDLVLNIAGPPEGTPIFLEREKFGMEFLDSHSRFWKTTDGSNTFNIRYLRYRIILMLWSMLRGDMPNTGIWEYEYDSLPG